MLHKILWVMLLCVAPVAVQAQSCEWSISGKVIDEHDQSALSYSNIILLETNQYAVADSNGYFIIRQVCSGKYTLIVEHIGCTPDTVTLDVNSSITRNFYLEHHEEELSGIITTAVKYTSGLSSHEVDSKEL
ncbi:MAG TPA: carboxypeptidase-like regulatory domain-containing protein, partial [Chitinophagales bacterium]|nr:carboxypeptidase-like regulatory domain-containing protein [Chitinophagales bacterium]